MGMGMGDTNADTDVTDTAIVVVVIRRTIMGLHDPTTMTMPMLMRLSRWFDGIRGSRRARQQSNRRSRRYRQRSIPALVIPPSPSTAPLPPATTMVTTMVTTNTLKAASKVIT